MTFVLLPGLDGTARLFARFEAALDGSSIARIAYPPDELLAYDALTEHVASRLPATTFVLVAESFSGPVALRVAHRAPPGLRAVVLVATFVRNPAPWLPRGLAAAIAPAVMRMPPPRRVVRRFLAGRDADRELVADILAAIGTVQPRVLAHRIVETLSVDVTTELSQCPVPVLYIAGRDDALLPRDTVATLRLARPSMSVVTLDAPHLVLQRQPAEARAAIADFLATLAAAPAGD